VNCWLAQGSRVQCSCPDTCRVFAQRTGDLGISCVLTRVHEFLTCGATGSAATAGGGPEAPDDEGNYVQQWPGDQHRSACGRGSSHVTAPSI
jgi:hypothetical protein